MKVTNKLNPNHLVITHDGIDTLQSYDSIICVWASGSKPTFSKHWDYSRTTMKYLGQFLNSDSKEIRAKFKSGEYKVSIDTDGNFLKD